MVTAVVGTRQAILQTFFNFVSLFATLRRIKFPTTWLLLATRIAQAQISEGRERYGHEPFRARAFLKKIFKPQKHHGKPKFFPRENPTTRKL
jgi:hypothetical protein